jgi:alpha-glucosidase (family GH31 glycosyl hydrolase)
VLQLVRGSGCEIFLPLFRWIAPNDKIAQTIDDEFLLGETILAAPVVVEGEHKILTLFLPHKKISLSHIRSNNS